MPLASLRSLAIVFLLGVAILSGSPAAAEVAWLPQGPVRIIVPFSPGGTSDVLARGLAERLGRSLGHAVVIENRPGAGGNIGAEAAARAPADGATLFFGGMSTNAINLALYSRKGADTGKGLVPVGLLISSANALLINPAKRDFASLADFVAAARKDLENLTYGSNGIGSVTHLTMELFKNAVGDLKIQHVPYRGSATTGLLSGDVTAIFEGVASATQLVQTKTLKALAVTTAQRVSSLPDIPTLAEAGIPGLDIPSWYAIFAPAGLDAATLDHWHAALNDAAADAAFAALLQRTGTSFVSTTLPAMNAYVDTERKRWADTVSKAAIKID